MAGSSLSSTTTTSHTLSADPPLRLPGGELHSTSGPALVSTLTGSPHTFLQPPPSLHSAALVLAKRYLDPLASAVSDSQLARRDAARRKRKRREPHVQGNGPLLQLNKVYLEGFGIDQVWEQARRVLDATVGEVEDALPGLAEETTSKLQHQVQGNGDQSIAGEESQLIRFDDDGFEIVSSDGDTSGEGEEAQEVVEEDDLNSSELSAEDIENEADGLEEDDTEEDSLEEDEVADEEPTEDFIEDPNGLNDGFFSIDTFNKQSEFLERRDTAGEPFDGSDEEEIDWDQDPMTIQDTSAAKDDELEAEEDGDDDEGDDEDGPTFGNMDLNAPEGYSDDDMGDAEGMDDALNDMDTMGNTNDILYNDFFAPPPRKASSGGRPSKHTRQMNAERESARAHPVEDDGGMQRTMEAVRRDLFEDELSADEEGDEDLSRLDPSDPKSRRSTHERRQAKLAEEIRSLEAANVAKREWTLTGEARAADRPMNSLLEEDLDFERTGKPVPVITAAISEDIEDMIKRRILAREFDEVVRRRPDDLATPGATRRGRFELDDTKPQQSLAEVYEEEHLRKVDPEGHKDKREEALSKEHREIEQLWAGISAKLDSLSSWHYKPKPPQPSINIVADVPTIAMEDARPTAAVGGGDDLGANSMLAPQEIYAPGKESAGAGEVVPKSGLPVARTELTREQKLRRRRREKERIKKQTGGKESEKPKGKRAKEKTDVMGALKKGGVRVIGRKGELRDVEGEKIKESSAGKGGGNFKL